MPDGLTASNVSPARVFVTVIALVAGGLVLFYLGNNFFWQPYSTAATRLDTLQRDVLKKKNDAAGAFAQKQSAAKRKAPSLPEK